MPHMIMASSCMHASMKEGMSELLHIEIVALIATHDEEACAREAIDVKRFESPLTATSYGRNWQKRVPISPVASLIEINVDAIVFILALSLTLENHFIYIDAWKSGIYRCEQRYIADFYHFRRILLATVANHFDVRAREIALAPER